MKTFKTVSLMHTNHLAYTKLWPFYMYNMRNKQFPSMIQENMTDWLSPLITGIRLLLSCLWLLPGLDVQNLPQYYTNTLLFLPKKFEGLLQCKSSTFFWQNNLHFILCIRRLDKSLRKDFATLTMKETIGPRVLPRIGWSPRNQHGTIPLFW